MAAKQIHAEYDFQAPPLGLLVLVQAVLDGGGAALPAGLKLDWGPALWKLQILEWTLLADQAGSLTLDIWKDAYANFPPLAADSIVASAKPSLSAAAKNQSAVLTGWTTTINAGDTLRFHAESSNAVSRVTVGLKCKVIP